MRSLSSRLIAGAVGLALAVAACGDDDGGGSSDAVDLSSGLASAAVCNGEPSEVNPPSSDPFSGYSYLNAGDGWTRGWVGVFGDQEAIVGDDATSILCIQVTESTEVERCEYEEEGESFTLVMVSASYDIELRNADTAEVVASDSLDVEAEECPGITSFEAGETERTSYPQPSEEQIQASLGPFLG